MVLPRLATHPWKLPVVSGIALAVSYFSYSLPILNFVALVPLLRPATGPAAGPGPALRRASGGGSPLSRHPLDPGSATDAARLSGG